MVFLRTSNGGTSSAAAVSLLLAVAHHPWAAVAAEEAEAPTPQPTQDPTPTYWPICHYWYPEEMQAEHSITETYPCRCYYEDHTYYKGCYAFPSEWYVSCKKGWTAIGPMSAYEPNARCGFLGEKGLCTYTGPQLHDYGCGCDEGSECLNVDCEVTQWSDWGDCTAWCDPDSNDQLVIGSQTRTRSVMVAQGGTGEACPEEMEETRQCSTQECQVDCEVASWSEWGRCSTECGGGMQSRTRAVTVQRSTYGASCPDLEERRTCNEQKCYWFSLRGMSGKEEVHVMETSQSQEYTLSMPKTIGLNSNHIQIKFLNDGTNKDVVFKFVKGSKGDLTYPKKWDDWKCGASNENKRCELVRKGKFNWSGIYHVIFDQSIKYSDDDFDESESTQIFLNHGICLDGTLSKGGKAQMWRCESARQANQSWTYDASTGHIKASNGFCLDAKQRNTHGGKVHMWTCQTNNKNQHWDYSATTGQIKAVHGICLAGTERAKIGGKVAMSNCDTKSKNQQWTISQDVISGRRLR